MVDWIVYKFMKKGDGRRQHRKKTDAEIYALCKPSKCETMYKITSTCPIHCCDTPSHMFSNLFMFLGHQTRMVIFSPILSHIAYLSSRGMKHVWLNSDPLHLICFLAYLSSRGTKHTWLYSDLLQGLSGEPFTRSVFSGGDLNFCVVSTPPLECRMFSIAAVIVIKSHLRLVTNFPVP